jgi:hypothetical protein
MKGFARWACEERMRPGRGLKLFSSAIASLGNVRKVEPQQCLDVSAHLARIGRTLPECRESPRKTRPRPRRTLPAFILPSFGWFLLVSPIRALFFAGLRPSTPERAFSLTGV